jgi:thymidylate synthase (methanogen type)
MVLPEPKVITGNSIGETHDRIIAALIKEGCENEVQTEDNEYTWEYPSQIIAHVRYPTIEPFKSVASPFTIMFLDQYRLQMRTLSPKRLDGQSFTYTYGNRYLDFARCGLDGSIQAGDGDGSGIDQLSESVVKRLINSPSSRRAVMVAWNPILDLAEGDPPCVDLVQFLLRDGILSATAYIRSNDMLLAWPSNAYGLSGFMESAASNINERTYEQIVTGSLTTISTSAHLYPVRDANVLRKYHEHLIGIGLVR